MKNRAIQRIYHLADERNWQSIQTHGLLSAAHLLEQAGETHWLNCYRPQLVQLANGIIIRDQRPMPPQALIRCLDGLMPADWYALLNNHIFFWVELERLNRQRQACDTPQYIITIDAENLLSYYADCAAVTPFNVGNARRAPARRGLASLVPYNTWVHSGWESEAAPFCKKVRPASHKPVELLISEAVPNILDFVLHVDRP